MKVVILAGGLGTRLSEETVTKPKPMVEIGDKPILWHVMKIYSSFGYDDFIICLGYKGYMIKEYFLNYALHNSDVTVDIPENSVRVHHRAAEPWRVTLVDTGLETMTGGRLRRVRRYLDEQTFLMTYGDGVGDIDVADLVRFHNDHGRLATVTAVRPVGRFGTLTLAGTNVEDFQEKAPGEGGWINAGFFALSPKVIDFIGGDSTVWEREPLERLAHAGELQAYKHERFWQPMDTLRDRSQLTQMWEQGAAPWAVWQRSAADHPC
jgi:glucose-1-phosphate cytidylyltransferase